MEFDAKQLEAINASGESILVSAGAGSGKTQVLGARVLRLIKEGVKLDEILILTFTKDAAYNMKERIKVFIRKDKELSNDLLNEVDTSDITNFDGYMNRLLNKYGYLIGVKSNFSVLTQDVFDYLVNKFGQDIIEEFFEKDDKDIKEFFDNYLLKDKELLFNAVKTLIGAESKLTNKDYRVEYFKLIDSPDYLKKINNLAIKKYLLEIFNIYQKLNSIIASYYPLSLDKELKKSLTETQKYLCKKTGAIKVYEYLLSVDFSDNNIDYYNVYTNIIEEGLIESVPTSKNEEINTDSDFINFAAYVKESLTYQKKIDNIFTKNIDKEAVYYKKAVRFIYKLTDLVYEKLNKYKEEKNVYTFNDISLKVLQILKEFPHVSNELKNKYKEIMIDECQDNSDIQEEFIKYLDNNNLFMVGDIKQSIYMFRNANPILFINRKDRYNNPKNSGRVITMDNNYRSTDVVINDINDIFSNLMTIEFGKIDYVNQEKLIANRKDFLTKNNPDLIKENVIYQYCKNPDKVSADIEFEAKKVSEFIYDRVKNKETISFGDKKRSLKYSDFAIIVDRTSDFDKIVKALTDKSIPVINKSDKTLTKEDFLIAMKNLILLVSHISKKDFYSSQTKLAFISVSRSFILNKYDDVIDNELNDITKSDLFKLIIDVLTKYDSGLVKTILLEIFDKLEISSKICSLKQQFYSLVCYNYILNLVDNFSSLNFSFDEIIQFYNYSDKITLETKAPILTDTDNAVTLINTHKSKGLEYNIVYYIGLGKQFRKDNDGPVFAQFDKVDGVYPGLVLPVSNATLLDLCKQNEVIKSTSKKLYSALKDIYIDSTEKMNLEEKVRLFYVGLTRAKFQMILFNPVASNVSSKNDMDITKANNFNSYLDFIDKSKFKVIPLEYEETTINTNIITPKKISFDLTEAKHDKLNCKIDTKSLDEIAKLNENKNILNKRKASIDGPIHVNLETIEFSNKLHEILSYLDYENLDTSFIQNKSMKIFVENFVSNEIIKECIKNGKIYQEYTYFNIDTKSYNSIDFLCIFKDHFVIVDYKLKNIDDNLYKTQLETYKSNVERIFKLKKSKLYLFSLVDNVIKEL